MRGESLSGPPPRRIGIRDVAQRAGVAISTVSKVFSGRGEVMPALRVRVLDRSRRARLPAQLRRPEPPPRRDQPDRLRHLRPVRSVLGGDRRRRRVRAAAGRLRPPRHELRATTRRSTPPMSATSTAAASMPILVSPSREDDPGLLAALAEFDGPIVVLESELRATSPVDAVCADHRDRHARRRRASRRASATAGSPR